MIAKCGPRRIPHWAHSRTKNCDPWWEPETEWHRNWKNQFPQECREVTHRAPDGEIHRADVKTPTGVIVELQHSSITDVERLSREAFYGQLVWIVDGLGFRKNFDIYHMLPDPKSEMAKDIVWGKAQRHLNGAIHGLFFRWSEAREENPGIAKGDVRSGLIHSIEEIRDALEACYNGYHQYDWVKPRRAWLESGSPVYIDFGEETLVKLDIYDDSDLRCIRRVGKREFIRNVMVESDARNIDRRLEPIE
jgi:hypothetical protein